MPKASRDTSPRTLAEHMKPFSFLPAFLISLFFVPPAFATSRVYSTIDQLITSSDLIAVVMIKEPNEASRIERTKEQPFGFANSAQILRQIKGDIAKPLVIHHMSGLDDCLFQQGPGEYLVFLKQKGDKFIPTDGWPSSKQIVDKKVSGWSDMQRFGKEVEQLETVIEYIKTKS